MRKYIIILFITVINLTCKNSIENQKDKLKQEIINLYPEVKQEILHAFFQVERNVLLDKVNEIELYENITHKIEYKQIASKPLLYVIMTQELRLEPGSTVLEIGTGSGIQTALLSKLSKEVYSIEISQTLMMKTKEKLYKLGYENIEIRQGDGYLGWPDKSKKFDRIMITCSYVKVPEKVSEQLKECGYLLMPIGKKFEKQKLVRYKKVNGSLKVDAVIRDVVFLPMLNH